VNDQEIAVYRRTIRFDDLPDSEYGLSEVRVRSSTPFTGSIKAHYKECGGQSGKQDFLIVHLSVARHFGVWLFSSVAVFKLKCSGLKIATTLSTVLGYGEYV